MKITISTPVKGGYEEVKKGFTSKLFVRLNPPFPPVRLLRFDGCSMGDRVILELNFFLFTQKWESLITAHAFNDIEFSFTDEGIRLPFFLQTWVHHHRVLTQPGGGSVIVDDIRFTTTFLVTNLLLYPLIYLQFLYRKPIYRKVFGS